MMTTETMLEALQERYGADLIERVQKLLYTAEAYNVKIATAESLTAGGIAHLLASLDTNHAVLTQGNIVYNNEAKADMLGVDRGTLALCDAVSDPVAKQMAKGAIDMSDAQISVAVTGYAGAWGNDEYAIDGSTVFIGTAHKYGDETSMHAEEFHFDKARTTDIRQTIISAVGALELALDAYLTEQPELLSTIAEKNAQAFAQDPVLQQAATFAPDYGQHLSGSANDPLLLQEYGEEALGKITNILKQATRQGCKIEVVGDDCASEIAHALTTINGASRVVDRGRITPDFQESPAQTANHAKRNTLTITCHRLDNGNISMALSQRSGIGSAMKVDYLPVNVPEGQQPTRAATLTALDALENALAKQPAMMR
jgi:PncC family amidohydrolase